MFRQRDVSLAATQVGSIAVAILVAALILALVCELGWLRPEEFPSAQSWGVAGTAVGLVYGTVSGRVINSVLPRHTR
jgi:hypothetical protein